MMLGRRRVMGCVPAVLVAGERAWAGTANPAVPGKEIGFSVWRQGSRVGMHLVQFNQSGDALRVDTHAHFSVGLGPLKLFQYTYQVTEIWRDGALQSVAAQTDDNGTKGVCNAHRQGGVLQVSGSKSGSYTAPSGSIAGTHWNAAELKAPMINPENGVLMKFAVAEKGMSAPPGGGAAARCVGLTGFATLDIWYDAKNTWVGLRAVAKDKSIVEYRRV